MAQTNVSAKEFIKAWQTSNSVAEVAEKTGLKSGAVRVRGYNYRKQGVALKNITQSKKRDWASLAEYAKTFEEEEIIPF